MCKAFRFSTSQHKFLWVRSRDCRKGNSDGYFATTRLKRL